MRKRGSWKVRLRILAALALVVIVGGGWLWWHMMHRRPDEAAYPLQGIEVDSEDDGINWLTLKAVGADFAYLDASASAFARDPAFISNLESAREAGIRVGAVHRYDPCQPADEQAGNYVTVVPRDSAFLPPAVELEITADHCPIKVSDAAVESELMTFLNQIETHTGKPAILKLTRSFQKRYGISSKFDRNLWLVQDRFEPDYAGRPWTLWTANHYYRIDGGGSNIRWVVIQP